MLLMALMVLPAPAGPTWKMFGPMARSTGRAFSSAAASPPTMMASVAARAPVTPPLTGASRKCTPRARATGSILRGVDGSTLLRSIRMVLGLARSSRPPLSRYMASTSGDAGSEVSTTSEASTVSCAEAARLAPAWIKFSMALGFMSNTVIEKPAFSTLPAIGLPMFPTPMNPTERAIARLLWRDSGHSENRPGRAEHKPARRTDQRALDFALVLIGPVSIEETSAQNLLKLSTHTYWRRVWPAGLGLAAYITDRFGADGLRDRQVLDLGCGVGLIGIV